MRSAVAIAVAFFGSSLFATLAHIPYITVAVTNGFTRGTVWAAIMANGRLRRIPDLFRHSNIDEDGHIRATSAQFVRFVRRRLLRVSQGRVCCFSNSITPLVVLDGNPDVAFLEPLLLTDFRSQCRM
jgi:hypothetical protein